MLLRQQADHYLSVAPCSTTVTMRCSELIALLQNLQILPVMESWGLVMLSLGSVSSTSDCLETLKIATKPLSNLRLTISNQFFHSPAISVCSSTLGLLEHQKYFTTWLRFGKQTLNKFKFHTFIWWFLWKSNHYNFVLTLQCLSLSPNLSPCRLSGNLSLRLFQKAIIGFECKSLLEYRIFPIQQLLAVTCHKMTWNCCHFCYTDSA